MELNISLLMERAIEASLLAGKAILEVYNTSNIKVQLKDDCSPLTVADKKSHEEIVQLLSESGIPILSEEGKDVPYKERCNWNYFWLIDPLDGTKEFISRNGEFTVNIALIHKDTPVMGVVYVPVDKTLYYSYVPDGAYRISQVDRTSYLNTGMKSMLLQSVKLPQKKEHEGMIIVGSRSHMNEDTKVYIERVKKKYGKVDIVSRGSSLKICMVAEGEADIYPRFGPTMEWDTAAGHCIALGAGLEVTQGDGKTELYYNKENLLNPYFIVREKELSI